MSADVTQNSEKACRHCGSAKTGMSWEGDEFECGTSSGIHAGMQTTECLRRENRKLRKDLEQFRKERGRLAAPRGTTLRAAGTALDALRAEETMLLERLHRTANELNDVRQKILRRLAQ